MDSLGDGPNKRPRSERLFRPDSLGRNELVNALKLRLPCDHNFDSFKWADLVTLYKNHVIPKEQRVYTKFSPRGISLSSSQVKHREYLEQFPNLKRKMDSTTGLPLDPNVANKRIKLSNSSSSSPGKSQPPQATSHSPDKQQTVGDTNSHSARNNNNNNSNKSRITWP